MYGNNPTILKLLCKEIKRQTELREFLLPFGPEYFFLPFAVRCTIQIKIYRNIILPGVLHGCETGSLTLREGHRPRVFENRVLGKMFLPERQGKAE